MNLKNIKIILLIAIAFLLAMLWGQWQQQYAPKVTSSKPAATAPHQQVPNLLEGAVHHQAKNLARASNQQGRYIRVKTDVFNLTIDLNGGNIVAANLPAYPKTLKSDVPFALLSNQQATLYQAQSGFLSPDLSNKLLPFTAAKTDYTMTGNQLVINLHWHNAKGIALTKTYTFHQGSYAIGVNYRIDNQSSHDMSGRFYGQLIRQDHKVSHGLLTSYTTYTGAAVSYPDNHYRKVTFADMQESNLNIHTLGGWAAMVQHYFISAWAPVQKTQTQIYSRHYGDGLYGIGIANPMIEIPAKQSKTTGQTLYVGPAIAKNLNAVAPYLNKTIDYGWLWFISDIIFWVMSFIHGFVGNWGVSIILVTLLIKILFYPLSAKSYGSMARMRALQPKIQQLKERCGEDKQKFSKSMMEMYRKEKVNPLGGCLPIAVQIPVFIALYWMLMESVELRHAPFIFWIHDLSVRDPYFILPILMGISMFVQQKLNPPPPDPTQAKVMMALPVIFTVLFANFPAGLVLYWLVNNCVSILQQWYVMRKVANQSKKKR